MNQPAAAIIVAAGSGTRMNTALPKQYLHLAGKPILIRSIEPFLSCPFITRIIVVVPADRIEETRHLLTEFRLADAGIMLVPGGQRRQDSVQAGLQQVHDDIDLVLVHDGARPNITPQLIERCYRAIIDSDAAILAVPVTDTVKRATADENVAATIDRTGLWLAQTPQGARTALLRSAFADLAGREVTDEATLLEQAGIPVRLVAGDKTNIKITTPADLRLVEATLTCRAPTMRIGHGFDAHRFAEKRQLVLGGVRIAYPQGLAGHSDADVVTHALCDALLGALGLGDIGGHFPDHDPSFKDICSLLLLDRVMVSVHQQCLVISNADLTIVCQAPKLAPHIPAMRATLAHHCRCSAEAINIKATTTERMGFTGRGEGICCHAVVLLQTTTSQGTPP